MFEEPRDLDQRFDLAAAYAKEPGGEAATVEPNPNLESPPPSNTHGGGGLSGDEGDPSGESKLPPPGGDGS